MKARGKTREILKLVGQIQDLVGQARGNHWNDRDQAAFAMAQNQLKEAFDICLKITSMYEPVNN